MFKKSDEQKEQDRLDYYYKLGRAEAKELMRIGFGPEDLLTIAISDTSFDKGVKDEAMDQWSKALDD